MIFNSKLLKLTNMTLIYPAKFKKKTLLDQLKLWLNYSASNDVHCSSKFIFYYETTGFPNGLVVKNLPANAGDTEDRGLIPGLGRSLEKEMVTHSSICAWKIPRTEESGRPQSMGSKRIEHDWPTEHKTWDNF